MLQAGSGMAGFGVAAAQRPTAGHRRADELAAARPVFERTRW